jgi:hypothetical protein
MNWVFKGAAVLSAATFAIAAEGAKWPMFKGKFTLPYEVHWGNVVLPAGEYTIANSDPVRPQFMYVQTEGATYVLLAGPTADFRGSSSQLELENIDGAHFVKRLEVASSGTAYSFGIPKAYRNRAVAAKAAVETLGVMESK